MTRRRGPPADLEHLQLLLDRFRADHNVERPHQGIGNLTPAQRYLPGPTAETPLASSPRRGRQNTSLPPLLLTRKVDPRGGVGYDGLGIIIPRRHAGARPFLSRSAS